MQNQLVTVKSYKGCILLGNATKPFYPSWLKIVTATLMVEPNADGLDVLEVATGEIKRTLTGDAANFKAFDKADAKAQIIIMSRVDEATGTKITQYGSALEMLAAIALDFTAGKTGSHKLKSASSLLGLKQGPRESVRDYCNRYEHHLMELNAAGMELDAKFTVLILLRGVLPEFKQTSEAILTGHEDKLTVEHAREKLELVEMNRSPEQPLDHGLLTLQCTEKDEQIALLTAQVRSLVPPSNTGRHDLKGRRPCPLPRHEGHALEDCRQNGDPKFFQKKKEDNLNQNILDYICVAPKSILDMRKTGMPYCSPTPPRNTSKPTKRAPSKRATPPKIPNRITWAKNYKQPPAASQDMELLLQQESNNTTEESIETVETQFCFFSAPNRSPGSVHVRRSNDWYYDSGCTKHMCNDRSKFSFINMAEEGHVVKLGNGATIPVVGTGEIQVITDKSRLVTLKEVLFIPQLFCNLLSGSQIHGKNMEITFPSSDSNTVIVKDSQGNMVMNGTKNKNGLYRMNMTSRKKLTHTKGISQHNKWVEHTCESALVTEDVWHQRLGHIARERIRRIRNGKQVDGLVITNSVGPNTHSTNPCAACARAKMKLPHPTSVYTPIYTSHHPPPDPRESSV